MAKKRADGVKGCSKGGRNKKWCKVYRDRCIREVNKAKKRTRHLKNFPADIQAQG
jgi:hypothetical protein